MKHRLLLIFSLALVPMFINAQEWVVPPDRDARLAPQAFTDEGRILGEEIYNLNCKSCHGDPGKGNYNSQLNPVPGDPAGADLQSNSDGALQYKISEGKAPMPSFKNVLSVDDIWNVISYLRSFNNNYVQSVSAIQQLKDLRWSVIKILLSFNHEAGSVTATLKGLEGDNWTPVPFTGVQLKAKRYFGHITIDEPKLTDSNGNVTFTFPGDLPADRDGGMIITAELTDQDLFGTIRKDTTIMTGSANNAPSLTANRAMWNVGHKAPVWLLITYPAGVLLVWGFIFYVLLQLRTVYNEGNDEDEL